MGNQHGVIEVRYLIHPELCRFPLTVTYCWSRSLPGSFWIASGGTSLRTSSLNLHGLAKNAGWQPRLFPHVANSSLVSSSFPKKLHKYNAQAFARVKSTMGFRH